MRLGDVLMGRTEQRSPHPGGYSFDEYLTWFVNGQAYAGLPQTMVDSKQEPIGNDFAGLVAGAYKSSGVVFAVELARLSAFTEARFQYQRLSGGRPGDLWGDASLDLLERPWPMGTTGDLLARMLLDADMAGNSYTVRTIGKNGRPRLRRLRPDWTTIAIGSNEDAENPGDALDAEIVGLIYCPPKGKERFVPAGEFAHFAPSPDPLANFRGMSWLTPLIREIQGDKGYTDHKVRFLENGATPNMVVKFDPTVLPEQAEAFKKMFEGEHRGALNAYKTLFLGGGADATVVGANIQQLDFKATQGSSETRIAAAAGVGAVIAQLSEGMQGSSLNAGNFSAARRRFADLTIRPLWRNAAGSLEPIVPPPSGNRLWYDDRDIPFLRDDLTDVADIQQKKAAAIRQLVDAGYKAESVVKAIEADDFSLLVHSGLFSVQLQEPGSTPSAPAPAA